MRMFTKIKVNICFTHEYRAMHILGKSLLEIYLSLLEGEMLRICPSVPSSDWEIRGRCELLFRSELVTDRNPYVCEKTSRSVSVQFFA